MSTFLAAPSPVFAASSPDTIAQLPAPPGEAVAAPEDQAPSTPGPGEENAPPVFAPISTETLRAIITQRNLALPLRDANIIIYKAERRLELYSGSTLIKSYRVALGASPVGHKQQRGDSRTPEGRFTICTRNAKDSQFHIFLGLTYPELPDAERAVSAKQITPDEYLQIRQRLASRSAPLWETRLGGWIGIHGGTDAAFAQKKMKERGHNDWTAGCIALTNREIAELHAATVLGTPVEIRP